MKMLRLKPDTFILLTVMTLTGCIGTDILDDEIRPEVLEIDLQGDDAIALLIGENRKLEFVYLNEFGVAEDVTPVWRVGDMAVATVSIDGTVLAIGKGQTTVTAMVGGVESESVPINVSETSNDVNKVLVESPKEVIQVGEMVQLTATAWNVESMLIEGKQATWEVNDTNIAEVSQAGTLTALANGEVLITATIDNVASEPFAVQVGGSSLTATFSGRSGYKASGTATLFIADNGDLNLELSDDFDTDFALGTFIYLSNSTSGSATRSAGLEVAEISGDGGALFNVSEIDPNAGLDTYRYVIVLCKPASITFGVADFNP